MSAIPRDAQGNEVRGLTIEWSSTAQTVASVDATGLVLGLAAGNATIRAAVQGIQGSLDLQVKNADLPAITAAVNDPFTLALVANLTSSVRLRVQAALTLCSDGVANGNFSTIETCVANTRAEVAAATDPTDMAILASLALFIDHAERRLNA